MLKLRWIYWPPLIHLFVCFIALLGYVVPGLQFLGIIWSAITIADFPVSIVTAVLAFSQHGALAVIWAITAGTLWWYSLCKIAESLAAKIRRA
jgi:hypothetical protein